MARASRSSSLKTYWRTVRAVASKTDRPIKEARAIVREGRARGLTHTDLRKASTRRAGALLKSDRAKAPARFRLQRQRDERRADTSFDFGANVGPQEPAGVRVFDSLDDWIDMYDEA